MPVQTSKLGHIVLRVRDLARSERFYTDVLGLRKTGEIPGLMAFFTTQGNTDSHDLALMRLGPDAPDSNPQAVGLYHFAYQVGSEEALADAYRALRKGGVPRLGTRKHRATYSAFSRRTAGRVVRASSSDLCLIPFA